MTNNKHLSSQPHIGGITTQSTTNLERRNRVLSLLNQTAAHYISSSSCDNTISLNDINLQLHASSTVSNPYTFSISSNKSFSVNIDVSLPTTPTSLIWTKVDGKIWKCTIPKNVKRLKIYFHKENENDPDNYVIVGVTSGKTYDNMLLEEIIYNNSDGWGAVIKNLSSKIT